MQPVEDRSSPWRCQRGELDPHSTRLDPVSHTIAAGIHSSRATGAPHQPYQPHHGDSAGGPVRSHARRRPCYGDEMQLPDDGGATDVLDRAKGALVGLALGDALGTTLEFARRDTEPPVTDLVGGGPFGLAAGEWTDDTSMALCLADSLLAVGGLDARDLIESFCRWYEDGYNSVTGECFDIGGTTARALDSFRATGEPLSGSTDPRSAGNGSLMRLSPVAIRWWHDGAAAVEAARLQSRTTHGAAQAVEACALFAHLLVEAIGGAAKETVLRARDWPGDAEIAKVAAGSWHTKDRDAISSSGYVVHTLEAALWCVDRTKSVEEALILAANLADDADTVAAVTGQLAGALWGMSGVPAAWLDKLAWRDKIESLATELYAAAERERNEER